MLADGRDVTVFRSRPRALVPAAGMMAAHAPYVELHAHSAFSFLDGASTPTELAAAAAELGYPALALTDHDGVWGSMEFAHACKGLGVRAITGAELTVATAAGGSPAGRYAHLTLSGRERSRLPQPLPAPDRTPTPTPATTPARSAGQPWVALERSRSTPRAWSASPAAPATAWWPGAWERGEPRRAAALARRLLAAFGRERFRVELQRPYWRHDRARNRWLAGLAERLGVPCVATGNVHSHARRRARCRTPSSRCGWARRWRRPSRSRRGNSSSALASPQAMAARFAEHPEAVAETLRLAERLRFDLTAELGYRYPGSEDPGADRELAEVCRARLAERYARLAQRAREAEDRLEEELATIRHLGLSGFFLLHRDLLELAREVALEVRGPESARVGAAAGAREGLQRQLDRLLPDRPLPRRPGQGRPLRRPLPQRGGDRRCPTSTSTSRATSARC